MKEKKNNEEKTEINENEEIIDEQTSSIEEEIDENNEVNKIEELEKKVDELKDSLLRKAAEFENYKRRNEKEKEFLMEYAAESFIVKMLHIYDDLGRSIDHIQKSDNLASVKEGIEMVYNKFTKTLEAQGVKKIESKGNPFDFNLHEALMRQPADGVEADVVLEEVEAGYMYKDKVIKHAKVVVSQEIESSETNKDEDKN